MSQSSTSTQQAATPALTIQQPGPLALLQNQGRRQVQHLGVSQAGALDGFAHAQTNLLLGNPRDAVTIEITLGLFRAHFHCDTRIAIGGADCQAKLNHAPIHNWASHRVYQGDTIQFGGAKNGARAYLSVLGGWLTDTTVAPVFNNPSMNPKEQWPNHPSQLHAGDTLYCATTESSTTLQATPPHSRIGNDTPLKMLPWYKQPDYRAALTLRLFPAYQFSEFSQTAIECALNNEYRVAPQSDRMGYRLEGPAIEWRNAGITSEPIAFGSVQIPPSGQPMILLNDRQTLGGYPKLGCILREDCWQLAQRQAGQTVRLTLAKDC